MKAKPILSYKQLDNGKEKHIYLVDEQAEIKEGDWFYHPTSKHKIYKAIKTSLDMGKRQSFNGYYAENSFKIIASTDPSLRFPLLSEQSIKLLIDYYNKNGKMPESVEIDSESFDGRTIDEILDEVSYRPLIQIKLNSQGTVDISIPDERMYSREEVEKLTYDAMKHIGYTPVYIWQDWIKENLK